MRLRNQKHKSKKKFILRKKDKKEGKFRKYSPSGREQSSCKTWNFPTNAPIEHKCGRDSRRVMLKNLEKNCVFRKQTRKQTNNKAGIFIYSRFRIFAIVFVNCCEYFHYFIPFFCILSKCIEFIFSAFLLAPFWGFKQSS